MARRWIVSQVPGRYPVDFRKEVIQTLMHKVMHAESVCLVGLAGVGKSNLAGYIDLPEVRQRYLGSEAEHTRFLNVSCPSGATDPDDVFQAALDAVLDLAGAVAPGKLDRPVAGVSLFQALRSALKFLCDAHGQRIVFVLDEFEEAIRRQPADLFDGLRTLRDDQRASGRLQYVVITHLLPQLVLSSPPFHSSRLFNILRDNIYPLPPYRENDATWMLRDLCTRANGMDLSPRATRELLAYSAGHAGLLRALFGDLEPDFDVAQRRMVRLVEQASRTCHSCERIWTHLHRDEHDALRRLAAGRPIEPQWASYLHRRGLLAGRTPDSALFSPLFRRYIEVHQLPRHAA